MAGVVITFTPGQSEYGRWVFTGDINDVPPALKKSVNHEVGRVGLEPTTTRL